MRSLLYLLIALLFVGCAETPVEERKDYEFTCGAEHVEGDSFIEGDRKFDFAITRTKEHVRTGNHAVKIDKDLRYSLTTRIKDIKKGDVVSASAWRWRHGEEGFVVIAHDTSFFSSNYAVYSEDDWGKVETHFVADKDYDELKVYVHNKEESPAYFDDLEVKVYLNTEKPESENALKIELTQTSLHLLSQYRDKALAQDLITADLKQYVKATVTYKGEKVPVELRLKGDWTDHVETDKWSFRIKVDGGYSIMGLRSFSIQHPQTRGYMREWFAHQVFEEEDILTTTYTFVPVYINGEKKGVYALEEHFDKQLLESRHRREGPIVKFNESGQWQQNLEFLNTGKFYEVPAEEASEIEPFKKGRTYRTASLRNQFYVAKSHMERYRSHDKDLQNYMDIESVAKFLALADVLNGKHGMEWHNQRMYYNPITCKLEFIAYDCYTDLTSGGVLEAEIFGWRAAASTHFEIQEFLVNHPKVKPLYLKYLKKYSSPEYLNTIFKKLNKQIIEMEQLLGAEYPFARVEKEMFQTNAKEIKAMIPEYEKVVNNDLKETTKEEFQQLGWGKLFTEVALRADMLKDDSTKQIYQLTNFHSSPITVVSYTLKGSADSLINLSEGKTLQAFGKSGNSLKLTLEGPVRRIYYMAENCGDHIFEYNPSKWLGGARIETLNDKTGYSELPFRETENTLYLYKGRNYKMTKDVVIPEGKLVVFEAGVNLDITNGASFVSYSPVQMRGASNGKIKISSSDSSAAGFNIIAPSTKSVLRYVEFDGLSSMDRSFWTLTGAVTIYESDVEIDHCSFTNNHCEDALNLIRCDFKMSNSKIDRTTSDGFDADFCKGKLTSSSFSNTGNDCIDFSGSKITIADCDIRNAGDKGISGGEGSDLIVKGCTINGAHIAIASKDLSHVAVSDVAINKAKYGFAAYRKKPEYGPGKITVRSIKKNDVESLHLLEKGSELQYLNKSYYGDRKFDIDSMYMAYSK